MIGQIVLATLNQLAALLGWIFTMGLLLHILAATSLYFYIHAFGTQGCTLLTGWLGTPVHELGHALFCPIFGHKIKKIRLWTPSSEDGSIGSVTHVWNRRNIYQHIGNLFIAIGPILLGSTLILVGFLLLIPDKGTVFAVMRSCQVSPWGVPVRSDCLSAFFNLLFFPGSLHNPFFWGFLFLSFCIASHMGLSFQDVKGCLWGLAVLTAILLTGNMIALLVGFGAWNDYLLRFAARTRDLGGVLVFAVILSLANLSLAFLCFSLGKLLGFFRKN